MATLALCLLAGCYGHAGDLVRLIGEQVHPSKKDRESHTVISQFLLVINFTPLQEVTVEMLTELDRLVQLLESPIFTPLRMEVSLLIIFHLLSLQHVIMI